MLNDELGLNWAIAVAISWKWSENQILYLFKPNDVATSMNVDKKKKFLKYLF